MLLDANYDGNRNQWDVNLYGEVDIYNAESLKNELHSLIAEKSADIVLDLLNVGISFLDCLCCPCTSIQVSSFFNEKVKGYHTELHTCSSP